MKERPDKLEIPSAFMHISEWRKQNPGKEPDKNDLRELFQNYPKKAPDWRVEEVARQYVESEIRERLLYVLLREGKEQRDFKRFLNKCRSMTKTLEGELNRAFQRFKLPIYAHREQREEDNPVFFRMNVRISPLCFSSFEPLEVKNERIVRSDNDAVIMSVHVDQKGTFHATRAIEPVEKKFHINDMNRLSYFHGLLLDAFEKHYYGRKEDLNMLAFECARQLKYSFSSFPVYARDNQPQAVKEERKVLISQAQDWHDLIKSKTQKIRVPEDLASQEKTMEEGEDNYEDDPCTGAYDFDDSYECEPYDPVYYYADTYEGDDSYECEPYEPGYYYDDTYEPMEYKGDDSYEYTEDVYVDTYETMEYKGDDSYEYTEDVYVDTYEPMEYKGDDSYECPEETYPLESPQTEVIENEEKPKEK